MQKKTLVLVVIGAIIALASGFGGIWFLLNGNQSGADRRETRADARAQNKDSAAMTATVDLFQLKLPCKRDAEGNTPIVHADFQLVVPIRHHFKIKENASRLRDIIATLLRNSDVTAINSDMESFKTEIMRHARSELSVEITEILVLHFDYDILRTNR